jgi:hypothetical protein
MRGELGEFVELLPAQQRCGTWSTAPSTRILTSSAPTTPVRTDPGGRSHLQDGLRHHAGSHVGLKRTSPSAAGVPLDQAHAFGSWRWARLSHHGIVEAGIPPMSQERQGIGLHGYLCVPHRGVIEGLLRDADAAAPVGILAEGHRMLSIGGGSPPSRFRKTPGTPPTGAMSARWTPLGSQPGTDRRQPELNLYDRDWPSGPTRTRCPQPSSSSTIKGAGALQWTPWWRAAVLCRVHPCATPCCSAT